MRAESQGVASLDHTSVRVRAATAEDASTLARMRFEFRSSLGPCVEVEADFIARCERWMAERLANAGERDGWRAWVAERAGVIVGTLWLQTIEKIPNPTREPEWHAYITNVYVQPTARGGVGNALVRAAIDWCNTHEPHSVILWPTKRSAALYRRFGFAEPEAMLELELGEGPDRSGR